MQPGRDRLAAHVRVAVGVSLVLLACAGHVRAAAWPPSGLATLGLSGSLALDYYSSNHGLDDRQHFPGLNLVLKQRRALGERVRWVAEARVLAQQVGHEDEDAPHASLRSLRYADEVTTELREGYFEVAGGRWEVRAGKQLIVWGRADELNPTDVLTPKNFLLLLPEGQAGYRFGVNAVKLDYFVRDRTRASAVWIPFFTPSVIPLSDLPPGVHVEERVPPTRLGDGTIALKLDQSGDVVDASLAYAYGFNLLPEARVAQVELDPETGGPRGHVALVHGRQHMIGADFATSVGRFGYRGEVAYVHTDNPNGRRVDAIVPYLAYVFGIERSVLGDLSVILQYVGRYVPERVDPAQALTDPDPARGVGRFLAARATFIINQQLDTVQNGWSLRLDKKFWNDTLDCELLSVHYVERNDFFLRPKLTYALADGWRATLGGEIFHGPARSFFGRVKKNTGAFVELAYSF